MDHGTDYSKRTPPYICWGFFKGHQRFLPCELAATQRKKGVVAPSRAQALQDEIRDVNLSATLQQFMQNGWTCRFPTEKTRRTRTEPLPFFN